MGKTILVSGAPRRVEAVAAALAAEEVDVVTVTDLAALGDAVVGRELDVYVQLPVDLPTRGHSVVARMGNFLADGLLERFRAVETVEPALAGDATLLIVPGHLPVGVEATDDQQARLALLRVLANAACADSGARHLTARVASDTASAQEIAERALGRVPSSDGAPVRTGAEMDYADFRTQMVGLTLVET